MKALGIAGLCGAVALAAGFAAGWWARGAQATRYQIEHNGGMIIKIDRHTGQAWRYFRTFSEDKKGIADEGFTALENRP